MPSSEPAALRRLAEAVDRPFDVAASWRAGGGQVVGLLGHLVPRELVAAAGLLPLRLARARLAPGPVAPLPSGLAAELPADVAPVLAALLDGSLGWCDALLIGRDRTSHVQLFATIRELRRLGELKGAPEVAFVDLLRVPSAANRRYNRRRAEGLVELLGRWSGRAPSAASIREEVAAANALAQRLAHLSAGRGSPSGLTGSAFLAVAGAAGVLPRVELGATLDALEAAPPPAPTGGVRAFVAGSPIEDRRRYELLEAGGLALVGEDHDRGAAAFRANPVTPDPLDGLLERYAGDPAVPARLSGRARVETTLAAARAARAEVVVHLVEPDDETCSWELPALRRRLGDVRLRLVTARLNGDDPAPLLAVAAAATGDRG